MSLLQASINYRGPLYRKQLERDAEAASLALRERVGSPVVAPPAPPPPVEAAIDPSTFPRPDCLRFKGATRVSVWEILTACAAYYKVPMDEVITRRRRPVVGKRALHVACYLARVRLGASYPRLGMLFGDRDPTSISHAYRKIFRLVEADDPQTLLDLLSVETALAREADYVAHAK
jgi:hypothetical protein